MIDFCILFSMLRISDTLKSVNNSIRQPLKIHDNSDL